MPQLKLTVLTPVFNEEQVIAHFHERTTGVLDRLDNVAATIVYVVDRCTDNTLEVLRGIVAADPRARVIALSSRFGHQMSLLAGIEHSLDADAIIMMDSDLQHPPELIPELLDKHRQGYDVVYTVRRDTEDASFLRKSAGNMFYFTLGKISQVPINPNAADFRLISNRVAQALASGFRERNMFLRGLFSWIGFNQTSVEYTAEKRFAGQSKYSLSRMIKLAMAGILSFSTKPLQLSIFVGASFALLAFLLIIVSIIKFFLVQSIPNGWTTLVVLLLLFSGIQLIVLGIMGAYVGGIYEEVKGRPRYIVAEEISHE
ncbi:glycosyltransferase family 2 protein [Variovorax sp. J22G21]|uniref:glycosyltransferase family 2 protein n=1 Tax=Variovorax fucosicus TaxID=3053517 RepID=UPI002575B473|nr:MULTISPECIES: glycosyltransferase family 2 protein [unclassified Variovorax]MDM0038523.1 glycosyltransferase family 2 protein [Variovorax sp. J22R193]MDM0055807.1 glycosyltransferase family 2 protein [Variovorax sp. J22G47]MDM0063299.1 glycosyltransferase family 2 protein [Variovorax sp. J22G21]